MKRFIGLSSLMVISVLLLATAAVAQNRDTGAGPNAGQGIAPPGPTLGSVDWANVQGATGGTDVKFHLHWQNTDPQMPTAPITGNMSSQLYGAFMPDLGLIGSFDVPSIAANSFFDVFLEVPLASLPPSANQILPGSGPGTNSPCPPRNHWDGNVDIVWSGAAGQGQVHKHMGRMLVCPGAGNSYIHVITSCNSPLGAGWTILGVCPGFNATLVNPDLVTPAPNPVPPGWNGFLCVSAPASTPVGTTCCFVLQFGCNGALGLVELCATTCNWGPTRNPTLSVVDWTTLPGANGPDVRFHMRWANTDAVSSTAQITGDMSSQPYGAFLADAGPIGSFDVPSLAPNSFFDIFTEVSLASLPPTAPKILPGGGPGPNSPCPPQDHWDGNVDIHFTGPAGGGQVTRHPGRILVCPGAGRSYIHVMTGCASTTGAGWTISGLCPGFNATLVENDHVTPAPNPIPPGWSGYICVSSPASTPIGTTCCFIVTFVCGGVNGVVELCATTCNWGPTRNPTLSVVDWTTLPGANGPDVRFHMRWSNTDAVSPTAQITGDLSSQPYGTFLADAGPIGSFDVPSLAPNSFFDIFTEVSLASLPPTAPKILPGGGPGPNSPCPPQDHWDGNVDIHFTGPAGAGQVLRHPGQILVCPGAGRSYIHVMTGCTSAVGATWTISGLCPGFNATLVENDHVTPAPNPIPPGWSGYICVSAPASTPIGTTCCFIVTFVCNGVNGVVELCATTCNWGPTRNPTLSVVDWTTVPGASGPDVRFHMRWSNPDPVSSTAQLSGNLHSQPFGVFLQDAGPIGSFDVPSLAPNSFFDIFTEVSLSSLPPTAVKILPGGGPPPNGPCPPQDHWDGNVDINWNGPAGVGQVNRHFGQLLVCPGAGNSYIHVITNCNLAVGATWTILGLCPGFNATLVNDDHVTPAPNPVPPGWVGYLCVSAPASTPVATTCCFALRFDCGGQPGIIEMCVTTCNWGALGVSRTGGPVEFGIRGAVPNPTSGSMLVRFGIPRDGMTKLEVFDASGERVSTLLDSPLQAGTYSVQWDGRGQGGRALAPGTYFLKLQAGGRATSRKVVLFR